MNQRLAKAADQATLGGNSTSPVRVRLNYPTTGGALIAYIAILDFAVIYLSMVTAWWIRFETPLAGVGVPVIGELTLGNYTGHIILGAALMTVILFNFRAYENGNLVSAADDLRLLLRYTLVWLVCFLGLWLTLKIQPSISRIYCIIAATCIFFFLALWRHVLVTYLLPARWPHARRQIVLVGWSSGIERITAATEKSGIKPFEIKGVYLRSSSPSSDNPTRQNIPELGTYAALLDDLKTSPPDGVLVADHGLDGSQLSNIASLCEREMVDFEIVPSCFPSLVTGLSMRRIFGVPVLGISKLPLHSHLNSYLKRSLDIVGGLVGLALSAPAIAIFGLLIKRESPGPIFYKQRRVGQNGRTFDIIKLRSMRTDAETDNRPGWTISDDPRCLKVGRFMRSWNIDELPQFWNVIKGEMSLVGPRPERPELIAKFKDEILHYNARHSVKPGITGWAQVNGLRGDTDLTERIQHDLHYIENWSLPLDLQILIRTFLTRKGAC